MQPFPSRTGILPMRQERGEKSRGGATRMLVAAFAVLLVSSSAAQTVPELPTSTETPAEETVTTEHVPDSLLDARLRAIFGQIEAFSDARASVTEGVVRLSGSVQRPEDRRRAEELTSSLPGVVYVINNIEASADVETRLTPAVDRIQQSWTALKRQLPVLLVALFVLLLFVVASYLLGRWHRPARWTRVNPLIWGLANRLLRAVLVLIGLLLAFDILGITSMMGAILGTAGIVGLAIGFAFRDIVENYLAGLLLSLRRPFTVNDLVRVGEFEGKVVRLTSREVILLTLEGNNVRLPNSHVFKSPLINYTANPRRLFSVEVGLGVEEDLQRALDVGVGLFREMPGIMNDPGPFGRVLELGESSVKVRFYGWVDQREADYYKVRSEATRLIKAALDEAGIEMPEPIVRVLTSNLADSRKAEKQAPRRQVSTTEIDVRPDGKLEEQVREDLERSDDENLLSDGTSR